MTTPPSAVTASRLEKAAVDNGFDRDLAREGEWLPFASTQCPLRIWLGTFGDAVFLAAFSDESVLRELGEHGTPMAAPLPPGVCGGRSVPDIPAMHRMLRRAFQLSRSLPDEPLHAFVAATATLRRETEAERLVVQRVGQELFRRRLLDYWDGRCAVTGLAVPDLLRASHIKRWADCETDAERLHVYNGLLLAPHLDALFDLGFITVDDDGGVVVSGSLGAEARRQLGIDRPLRVRVSVEGHRGYLAWHRREAFRGR